MKFPSAGTRRIALLQKHLKDADAAVVTQWAYIAEAAFEYFIALTISGAFLTLLIKQMNVSDALTGIISSVTILACSMQVFAVTFIRRRRSIRASVLFLQTLQQLLYGGLFLLPFVPFGHTLKVTLFVTLFLFAAILTNLVAPAKFNWMMSFVQPCNRGVFTAHKEMVSLVTGLVYNFVMSRVVDHYDSIGRPEVGLRLCAIVIFVLMGFHVISLLVARDAPQVLEEVKSTPSLAASLRATFANRGFVKILVIVLGWNFAAYISTPYYNVYLLQELDCSVTYIAIAGIVGSVARLLFSMPIGKFGDRYGFAHSVGLGFIAAAISFLMLIFWVPGNGKVLYLVFQIPYAAAMAALSGGLMNIVFQYVPSKDRVGALGIYSALGGMAGFLGSLVGGVILGAIQSRGNTLLGLPLYGQQFLNVLSFVGLIGLVLYDRFVVEPMKRVE